MYFLLDIQLLLHILLDYKILILDLLLQHFHLVFHVQLLDQLRLHYTIDTLFLLHNQLLQYYQVDNFDLLLHLQQQLDIHRYLEIVLQQILQQQYSHILVYLNQLAILQLQHQFFVQNYLHYNRQQLHLYLVFQHQQNFQQQLHYLLEQSIQLYNQLLQIVLLEQNFQLHNQQQQHLLPDRFFLIDCLLQLIHNLEVDNQHLLQQQLHDLLHNYFQQIRDLEVHNQHQHLSLYQQQIDKYILLDTQQQLIGLLKRNH